MGYEVIVYFVALFILSTGEALPTYALHDHFRANLFVATFKQVKGKLFKKEINARVVRVMFVKPCGNSSICEETKRWQTRLYVTCYMH